MVGRLLRRHCPDLAHLAVRAVEPQGHDNRTFRIGETLAARLPSARAYAGQPEKEFRWMPVLAAGLPVPIPAPTHLIEPDTEFPWPWTVRPWLSGQPPSGLSDSVDLAEDLAGFLRALWRIDPGGGPLAGRHSFFRGAALEVYDRQARDALTALSGELDAPAALAVWEAALAQPFSGPPVWFHGDFAPSNLLVREGRLSAVIDFGCCGVGDPACDLTVAWTLLHGPARAAFREALEADEACWARARGWAIWKAAISVPEEPGRKRSEGLERVRRLCAQGC